MPDSSAYAAAEIGTVLRGDDPGESVREFAGLIDDEQTLRLLNYYDSLLDQPIAETAVGQQIIARASTETVDRAVKNGSVSQMKTATGITGQDRDGHDFYGDVASRLEYEGAIGITFGPPGAGKTSTTIDAGQVWRARTGGALIGNTSWDGFDRQFESDTEMLEAMASIQGPVLAIIDEIAQELSGFGEGSKDAEKFSDALLFIRKMESRHGDYAKKGSVLLVGHTRKKVAKSIRRVASFGIEKPYRDKPDFARVLDSEGGKDTWSGEGTYQGLTDTAESYSEYEASEFRVEEVTDDDGEENVDAEETERREAIKTAVRANTLAGMTYEAIAEDLVDYGDYWVGERVREWKDGDHDFVDVDRSVIE